MEMTKPLSKANQAICRQLILANELVVHSEELKGEEAKEMMNEARRHVRLALDIMYGLTDDLLKAIERNYTTIDILSGIRELLKKYPNRRVHVAIKELIGEEVYNAIKEEL